MTSVLIDGRPADAVPVADRGLQYGDGLFETIAVFRGAPCLWQAHLDRLAEGCRRLGMPMPDAKLLHTEASQLTAGVEQGVLKLLITRGVGGRGYRPPAEPHSCRILSLHPWPDHPAAYWIEGVRLRWCDTPLGLNPRLAGVKHCNRLEQVLARNEWDDSGIAEGLMCDARGRVIEGTMSNLFVLKDGRLSTPRLDQCGVAGVARAVVMAVAAEQGMPCAEAAMMSEQVIQADALLMSNAIIGLWPVAALDDQYFDRVHWPREMMAEVMERLRRP